MLHSPLPATCYIAICQLHVTLPAQHGTLSVTTLLAASYMLHSPCRLHVTLPAAGYMLHCQLPTTCYTPRCQLHATLPAASYMLHSSCQLHVTLPAVRYMLNSQLHVTLPVARYMLHYRCQCRSPLTPRDRPQHGAAYEIFIGPPLLFAGSSRVALEHGR